MIHDQDDGYVQLAAAARVPFVRETWPVCNRSVEPDTRRLLEILALESILPREAWSGTTTFSGAGIPQLDTSSLPRHTRMNFLRLMK